MPYSRAHHIIILLLIITVIAFWPSYFGQLNQAPMAHHFHGVTATLWMLLLATQNGLIHHGKRSAHRQLGLAFFVLVPMMTAAFAWVTWAGAVKAVNGHPFYQQFGQALLTADSWLLLTTSAQVYLALRLRRQVQLHSALMLGTLVGLMPPILSRLLVNWIPSWEITGMDTLHRFGWGLDASMIISLAVTLLLFVCYRKHGWPWLMAAGILLVMYGLYRWFGYSQLWASWVQALAATEVAMVIAAGFLVGLLAAVFGWMHGQRSQLRSAPSVGWFH